MLTANMLAVTYKFQPVRCRRPSRSQRLAPLGNASQRLQREGSSGMVNGAAWLETEPVVSASAERRPGESERV